jgi:hypothetical protein
MNSFLTYSPIIRLYSVCESCWKRAPARLAKTWPIRIVAPALIVAIRTAKWAAKSSADAPFSDVDVELDKEVSFAAHISIPVMPEPLRRHESHFPHRNVPIYESGSEQDSPP